MLLYYYKSEGFGVCDILEGEAKKGKERVGGQKSGKEEIVCMFMFPERIDLQKSLLWQWAGEAWEQRRIISGVLLLYFNMSHKSFNLFFEIFL